MTLDGIRVEIDAIDSQMKPLFIRRMECARRVAEMKAKTGGDVYVPEREAVIIERRASDVDVGIYDEYVAFLKQLMSICRRYEYGILPKTQEEVLTKALKEAGMDAGKEHQQVKIAFCLSNSNHNLNLFINMVSLNQIDILSMSLETKTENQIVHMTLKGNVEEGNMRKLLCQIGKEAENFQILELI